MTKEEKKAYDKEYYERNKEKKKAYWKEHSEANKEIKKQRDKNYRQKNKDKIRSKNRSYYQTEKGKEVAKECNKRHLKKLNLANAGISLRTLRAWAHQVKERDGNICQLCGSNNKLHAHHILSKSKHPDHALFINNGITLCEGCHIEEHILNGDI